jgi:hypothetical protein
MILFTTMLYIQRNQFIYQLCCISDLIVCEVKSIHVDMTVFYLFIYLNFVDAAGGLPDPL